MVFLAPCAGQPGSHGSQARLVLAFQSSAVKGWKGGSTKGSGCARDSGEGAWSERRASGPRVAPDWRDAR